MEGSELESEVRVGDIDNKHVSLSIYRSIRAPRLKLAARVKPKKISSPSTSKRDRQVISAIPSHEVFIFLNPQLLAALQVEYQNKSKSPFEAHPVHMWTFLTAVCFYSMVFCLKTHTQNRSGPFALILNHALLVSGSLSSASLLSMFHSRLLLWFLCIIGVYVPLMLAHHLLKTPLAKVLGTLVTLTFRLRDNLNVFVGRIGQWRQNMLG